MRRIAAVLADLLADLEWDARAGLAIAGDVHPPGTALAALRDHVYARYFCRWSPIPSRTGGDPDFVARLVAATGGARYWSDGWETVLAGESYAFVSDGTITLFVDEPDAIRPQVPVAGNPARVLLACARENLAPGFCYLIGTHGRFDRTAPYPRLYLNLRPAGAPGLIRALLAAFGRLEIPFEAKVASDPAEYGRVDPAVVYVAQRDFAAAVAGVCALAEAQPRWWREATPLFTLPLARGIAAAECPPDAGQTVESFGQHRCRLLARGVLSALQAGERAPAAAHARVAATFADEGIDLARPWAQRLPAAFWDQAQAPSHRSGDDPGSACAIGVAGNRPRPLASEPTATTRQAAGSAGAGRRCPTAPGFGA